MTECVNCNKFWTCQKSDRGYQEAKMLFPEGIWQNSCRRVEYMREQFEDCDEYE